MKETSVEVIRPSRKALGFIRTSRVAFLYSFIPYIVYNMSYWPLPHKAIYSHSNINLITEVSGMINHHYIDILKALSKYVAYW
jgi:uncharacterized membrane protein (GlpM family)